MFETPEWALKVALLAECRMRRVEGRAQLLCFSGVQFIHRIALLPSLGPEVYILYVYRLSASMICLVGKVFFLCKHFKVYQCTSNFTRDLCM